MSVADSVDTIACTSCGTTYKRTPNKLNESTPSKEKVIQDTPKTIEAPTVQEKIPKQTAIYLSPEDMSAKIDDLKFRISEAWNSFIIGSILLSFADGAIGLGIRLWYQGKSKWYYSHGTVVGGILLIIAGFIAVILICRKFCWGRLYTIFLASKELQGVYTAFYIGEYVYRCYM